MLAAERGNPTFGRRHGEKIKERGNMYIISFSYDQEDAELNLYITEDGAEVYRESIIGVDDIDDARLTCLEVAKSRGLWPAMFDDDPRVYGSAGGKKSSANMTDEQRRERAKKAAAKRWKK
jgi:hypothetical protein